MVDERMKNIIEEIDEVVDDLNKFFYLEDNENELRRRYNKIEKELRVENNKKLLHELLEE